MAGGRKGPAWAAAAAALLSLVQFALCSCNRQCPAQRCRRLRLQPGCETTRPSGPRPPALTGRRWQPACRATHVPQSCLRCRDGSATAVPERLGNGPRGAWLQLRQQTAIQKKADKVWFQCFRDALETIRIRSMSCPSSPWDSTQVQHNSVMIGRFRAGIRCPMNAAQIQVRLLAKFKPKDLHNRSQIQHIARRATSSLSTNRCTCMLDDEPYVTTADGSVGLDPRCCSSWCHGSARRAEPWGRRDASFNPHKRDRCTRSQAAPLRLPEVQDHLLAGRGKSCVGGRPGGVLPGA